MNVIQETNFDFLGNKTVGKVRDIYDLPAQAGHSDRFIFITTDRHSSFDRIIAHIPHKGAVLNLLSAFWFDQTKSVVPNHVITIPDPNVTVAKKCTPLPIEGVVRGYLTGSTNTSLWTLYEEGKREFGNFQLPDGMKKNEKLDTPVFTPSTKSNDHDRTLSPQEIVSEGILTKSVIDQVEKVSLALFNIGMEIAHRQGLILVDTKYEFGFDEDGVLTLIDEVHTPDSSRYWKRDSYEARIAAGQEPEYFDKEFLRLWFKEHSNPYTDETLPEAPREMVEELSRRYIEIYEQITEQSFPQISGDPQQRIKENLKQYARK